MTHSLSGMSRADAQIAALHLGAIDYATEVAEMAGTSVVVPADTMRAVLDYVERLVCFYNDATVATRAPAPHDEDTRPVELEARRDVAGNGEMR